MIGSIAKLILCSQNLFADLAESYQEYTDKKERKNASYTYKEIQRGAVAKS
jgi:hypothetical protein